MEKIVEKALKIDLHIHSIYSSKKDGAKVKRNTEDNIQVLVQKLNDNGVELCSVTDHDEFSYSMYESLKKYEKKESSLKKVLPGIEFSVRFIDDKVIHVIAIFDDCDNEKIINMEKILHTDEVKTWYNDGAFSKENFSSILERINTNFILIAHQKKTLTSTQKAQKTDVLSLGKEMFNELLFMEYFDAYEFRNKANEAFNKKYAFDNEVKDKLRFITGSDCHDWFYYPNSAEKEKEIEFTYIKALPTFRGLVMAITDWHRINYTGNFWNHGKSINQIEVEIEKKKYKIPISRGINVIIGDNSIGKSMILHALTDFCEITNSQLKRGYERYQEKKMFKVLTRISEEDIFKYTKQGQIREIFDDPNLKSDQYLSAFFPEPINAAYYREKAEGEMKKFIDALSSKFNYDDKIHNLHKLKIVVTIPEKKTLKIGMKIDPIPESDISNAIDNIVRIIDQIDILQDNKAIEEKDLDHIKRELEFWNILKDKYFQKKKIIKMENKKRNSFNTALSTFKVTYAEKQTDESNQYNAYLDDKKYLVSDILKIIKQKRALKPFEFEIKEIPVIPEENHVDTYIFVSKIGIEKINNQYFNELLKGILKKGETIDTTTITKSELKNRISRYPNEFEDVLEGFKEKIKIKMNDDFRIIKTITENQNDVFEQLSDGFNARIYFKLLAGEERDKGIYIIDQPEDHISPVAIKECVLEDFRNMEKRRQIIMVTHNPQFIINLDADNVIFISKKNEGLQIQSGALEYEDDSYKVLKIVADNIDGGVDSIQQRMKRYEKNI